MHRPAGLLAVAVAAATLFIGISAAPAAAEPDTPDEWITLAYQVCMDRSPSPVEIEHWAAQYGDGRSAWIPVMARQFCFGGESLAPTIADSYGWILERLPSQADLAYWTPQIRNARSLWPVERHLLASGERYATSGGTPLGYVEDLYDRVLGRNAGPTETTYWVARLASGEPRARTVDALLGTPEAIEHRVVRTVQAVVDRPPTEGELGDGSYLLRMFKEPRLIVTDLLHNIAPQLEPR
jgi:hypothetical protein